MIIKIVFKSGKKRTIKADAVGWNKGFFQFYKGNSIDHSQRIVEFISKDIVARIKCPN